MKKWVKQFFVFFIPTLAVALLFIPFTQNITFSDDVDASVAILSIDVPTKHVNQGVFIPTVHFSLSSASSSMSTLLVVGSIFIFAILLKQDKSLNNVKNHSPPFRQGSAG